MYNRMLFNIIERVHGKSHFQDMIKIFRCLTVSQRPLTRKEVAILTETNDSIVDGALSALERILSMTGGSDGEAVELIHLSLREYLVQRSSRLLPEEVCWSVWPFLSSALGLLRIHRVQLWLFDYAVLATICFHFQGLLRQHSTLGFSLFLLALLRLAFPRLRSSFMIALFGKGLEQLINRLLMVIFCVREEQTHLYLFERCLAVMSDPETGLKRDIRDNECPGHLQNQLKIQERWLQVQYPSRHWIAHLERSKTKSCAIDKTDVFLKEHFLHWLEALAYLGVVSAAVGELDIIKRIVQVSHPTLLSI